jgi:hypothetical protein
MAKRKKGTPQATELSLAEQELRDFASGKFPETPRNSIIPRLPLSQKERSNIVHRSVVGIVSKLFSPQRPEQKPFGFLTTQSIEGDIYFNQHSTRVLFSEFKVHDPVCFDVREYGLSNSEKEKQRQAINVVRR